MPVLLAAIVVLTLAGGVAAAPAADLSGDWVIDRAAWRARLDGLAIALLARLPDDIVGRIRARGDDPAQVVRLAATGATDSTIRFLADGRVRSRGHGTGPHDDGHWSMDGLQVQVDVGDVDGITTLRGTLDGDRITLVPVVAPTMPGDAPIRQLVFPLVRRH